MTFTAIYEAITHLHDFKIPFDVYVLYCALLTATLLIYREPRKCEKGL
jgi:hypothetical protein